MDEAAQLELFSQFLRSSSGQQKLGPTYFYQKPGFQLLWSAGFFAASIVMIRNFGSQLV